MSHSVAWGNNKPKTAAVPCYEGALQEAYEQGVRDERVRSMESQERLIKSINKLEHTNKCIMDWFVYSTLVD